MAEKTAYREAVRTGKYEKPSGLLGKYDNVRRFWEDQATAEFLAPVLNRLIKENRAAGKGPVRILDLGCGSGDGFELLSAISVNGSDLCKVNGACLGPDLPLEYIGVDINEDLICQAEACFAKDDRLKFEQGDLSDGLPGFIKELPPFDLYFAGYGTLSHFPDKQSAEIIADICRHAADGSVFVGDWLGRYSYEWQDLWPNPADEEYFMDYRISYIYPEDEREHADVSSFPLRLMTRDEVMRVARRAGELSGADLEPITFFDRSILVGRHMETGDYNRHCKPFRFAVNSLFEHYKRTPLDSFTPTYVPLDGFDRQNRFFNEFFSACNQLISYTAVLLEQYDPEARRFRDDPAIPENVQGPLRETMESMRKIVEATAWLEYADARANLIEPTLGYCLRQLEMTLQPGEGYGHGLVGVFTIRK